MIKNIMSVDLEDYYVRSPNEEWDSCESRILESCKTLLELFKKYSVRATFFTLGYVADRHPELIEEIDPSSVIGFSTEGELSSYQKIASEIPDNSCIVLGGFQKGHFSDSIQNKITNLYSVGNQSFEGHVVVSRILYEYEKTIFM